MKSSRSLSFITALLGFVLILASIGRAEPVSLSKTEAFELHAALTALAPGLSPENTLFAADAINVLEPDAKAFRTGYGKLLQLQQQATTPELAEKFKSEDAKFAVVADEKRTYQLPILTITKEDIANTKLSASTVATIKRLLKVAAPPPPPVAKN